MRQPRVSRAARRRAELPRLRAGPAEPERVAIEEQLEQVVGLIRDVLGAEVLGAYLYGSSVAGGLRPRSDLDVLVVAKRQMTQEEKRLLATGLLAISGRDSHGRRPFEVTVVVEPDVKPWRYPPRYDLQYGEWHRAALESGDVEPLATTTNPDVALLLTMVLQANRPLLGPPASELLDPVPAADLERAMVADVDEVMADLDGDTRNVVLTLARIWLTLETGEIGSKDAAAAWALERLPPELRPVLARARAIYLGEEDERWDDLRSSVRPFADHVVAEIDRLPATRATS